MHKHQTSYPGCIISNWFKTTQRCIYSKTKATLFLTGSHFFQSGTDLVCSAPQVYITNYCSLSFRMYHHSLSNTRDALLIETSGVVLSPKLAHGEWKCEIIKRDEILVLCPAISVSPTRCFMQSMRMVCALWLSCIWCNEREPNLRLNLAFSSCFLLRLLVMYSITHHT